MKRKEANGTKHGTTKREQSRFQIRLNCTHHTEEDRRARPFLDGKDRGIGRERENGCEEKGRRNRSRRGNREEFSQNHDTVGIRQTGAEEKEHDGLCEISGKTRQVKGKQKSMSGAEWWVCDFGEYQRHDGGEFDEMENGDGGAMKPHKNRLSLLGGGA